MIVRKEAKINSFYGVKKAFENLLIHAAANFASFFAFRGLSINESTFCFMVWK
jgi:hypothetical protein